VNQGARYLRQELSLQGFVMNEPYTEDWGYAIEIENPAFNLWIGCGNYEEHPDGFLCSSFPTSRLCGSDSGGLLPRNA
jgi:hypothetical protein